MPNQRGLVMAADMFIRRWIYIGIEHLRLDLIKVRNSRGRKIHPQRNLRSGGGCAGTF